MTAYFLFQQDTTNDQKVADGYRTGLVDGVNPAGA